ncbi:hypothetical protein [Aliidiomarina quisquiliarum]|uniref:hypothetical protein n=1 Tax=Aliidiomarina quisquiliarum TaxID=2938947 RepID=UPI00208F3325|nr:hypothetical protein [Aliidiomarina quisquiliarum]MCO4321050.1 hypothetical protein [Aliidiomarina quisquiliarum]
MIDFKNKLVAERHYNAPTSNTAVSANASKEADLERAFESDRGRIINSAPIRRLQQ